MIFLYRVCTFLLYPLLLIVVYYRKIIQKEDSIRFKEKIFPSCFNVVRKNSTKLIWFHAASIGEFKSIVPIINKLISSHKNIEILITTTTLSSGILANNEILKFQNVYHRFFPFDVSFLINNFLNSWKPNYILLVDSEIWPNLILSIKKRGIPLALINARLTSKSFNKWMKFPKTAKKIFSSFDLCLTSNVETKHYLQKLSLQNVYCFGNIKLISEIDVNKIKNLNEKFLQSRRFWVAASTHRGEDLFCLKTHMKIKEVYKDLVTIIIPRHINKTNEILELANRLKLSTQLLNKNDIISKNKEVVIVNAFGILPDYFNYAKSVFIGKSVIKKLKNDSGQNPIDAAKLGCKIYHGPYVYNFEEIYEILNKNNIATKIETYDELSAYLIKDLENPLKINSKSSEIIKNLGKQTLEDTMRHINNFIQ